MKTKIIIVDDHGIMLDGIEALLTQQDDLLVCGKATDPNFCLSLLRSSVVDILITDFNMPGMSGLQLLEKVKELKTGTRVIFLSMHDSPEVVQSAIMAGADGYILKKYAYQEILQAIRVVRMGGQYWSPEVNPIRTANLGAKVLASELTDREIEVLKLLVHELTTKEIAEKLFVSERTVDSHRKNLLRKTNSKNTVGLIKYAYANRLVE